MSRKDPLDTVSAARRDLRTAEHQWRSSVNTTPQPVTKGHSWSLKVTTVLKVIVVVALMATLYHTAPENTFNVCQSVNMSNLCKG